ncbi:DTR1 [Candida theae]|uniref:DTR1 n=1 Tax=Candida theae TaxID=1198502 RepID=A0AAD5FZ31_9ASCO|nr:DTR1 [Candida theae]KAI5958808.1 DTR1 [Candida theae]
MIELVKVVIALIAGLGLYALLPVVFPPFGFPKNIPTIPFYVSFVSSWTNLDQKDIYNRYLREKLQKHGAVKIYFASRWNILVSRPEYLVQVFQKEDIYAKSGNHLKIPGSVLATYTGDNVISAHGSVWKLYREVLSSSIQFPDISTIHQNTEKFLDLLEKELLTKSSISVNDLLQRYSLANVGDAILGVDFEALDDKESTMHQKIKYIKSQIFKPFFMNFPYVENFGIPSRVKAKREVEGFRNWFGQNLLSKYDPERENSAATKMAQALYSEKLTQKQFLDNAIIIMVAGHENPLLLMLSLLYVLAKYPEVQESVREETDPEKPFLTAVIYETLRLYPPLGQIINRCTTTSVWLDKIYIPKGVYVGYNNMATGRDRSVWGADADHFRPSRWGVTLAEINSLYSSCKRSAKLPAFHGRKRACLGERFALHESKCLITSILGKYRVCLDDSWRERITPAGPISPHADWQNIYIMEDRGAHETDEVISLNNEDDKSTSIVEQENSKPEDEPYCSLSFKRKVIIIVIVTVTGCLGPMSGNIYVPVLPQLQEAFHVSRATMNGTIAVFMAVFAFAPLIWASWADYGGRKTLYLVPLLFFILANVLLATVPANIGALYVLRILQAFGASSVMSVGAGTIADIIEPKDRAKAISIFMWGPQLGPVAGPLLSMVSAASWRWIFGLLAIFGFVVYLAILFFLPETLRYLVGNCSCYSDQIFVKPKLFQKILVEGYPRPPKPSFKNYYQLLKYKPVLLCSINSGMLFASFYGVMVTFAHVLKDNYSFNNIQTSISFLCPGGALIIGSTIGGWLSDKVRERIIARNDDYVPENRFSIQIAGLIVSMAGLIGYAWTVEKHAAVWSIFIFTFLTGFGMTWVLVATTTYLTECSIAQPSANVAIGNLMRNLSAAVCTAIIDILVKKMGFGWCMTGLGLLNLIGIGFVVILLKKGPQWRKKTF